MEQIENMNEEIPTPEAPVSKTAPPANSNQSSGKIYELTQKR